MKASFTKTLLFLAVFAWAGGYFPSTPVSADPPEAKSQKAAVVGMQADGAIILRYRFGLYGEVVDTGGMSTVSPPIMAPTEEGSPIESVLNDLSKVFAIAGGEEKPPAQPPPPTTEKQGPKVVSTETKDGVVTTHYDDKSRTETRTYPGGTKTEDKYDKDGKRTSGTTTYPDTTEIEVKLDDKGNWTSKTTTKPDSTKTEVKYDKEGEETSFTTTFPDGSSVTKVVADGSLIFNDKPAETPSQPTAGGETEGTGLDIPTIVPGAIGATDAGAAANRF